MADLIDLMEGVEDIPGTALHEGMPWGEWESFPGTVLTTLRGYHLFMQRPTFVRLKGLPLPQLVAELRRPEMKAAILAEANVRNERPGSMENALPPPFRSSLALTFPLTDQGDRRPRPPLRPRRPGHARGREAGRRERGRPRPAPHRHPAPARRPPRRGTRFVQVASGYLATIVNGVPVREHDTDTGARPGRVARPSH